VDKTVIFDQSRYFKQLKKVISLFDFEAIIWLSALISLFLINPFSENHFSLCPIKNMGFSFCPGCGLGHSVSFLLHGNLSESFHSHWFGIPATMILIHRIFTLFKQKISISISI